MSLFLRSTLKGRVERVGNTYICVSVSNPTHKQIKMFVSQCSICSKMPKENSGLGQTERFNRLCLGLVTHLCV